MAMLIKKLKSMLSLDVTRAVEDYDGFLRSALITTTSFQDIVSGNLNKRNRTVQLIVLVYLFVYHSPRYFTLCYAYTQDTETRTRLQNLLVDYGEELGLMGRIGNVCFAVFLFENSINSLFLRWNESRASLDFLTDWVHRVPDMHSIEDEENRRKVSDNLDNKTKHVLMLQLHNKTLIAKIAARLTNLFIISYETSVFFMFLYNQRPSFFSLCLATFNWASTVLFFVFPGNHFHALYLSFIAVTDYFVVRINRLKKRVIVLQTSELTNENLVQMLDDYDQLIYVFKKYNKVLKHLLRNMIQFYAVGLTSTFFVTSLKSDPILTAIVTVCALGYSLTILSTGIYVSQLHSKVFALHNQFASIPAMNSAYKKISLKNIFRLKLIVKELGSLEKEGQFVIGLRNGEGPATSRQEIFDLTITTLANTLLLTKFA